MNSLLLYLMDSGSEIRAQKNKVLGSLLHITKWACELFSAFLLLATEPSTVVTRNGNVSIQVTGAFLENSLRYRNTDIQTWG